jgi:hypothetical protein
MKPPMATVPVTLTCRCGHDIRVAATWFPPSSPGDRVEVDPTHCRHCDRPVDLDDAFVEAEGVVEDMDVDWSDVEEDRE